MANPTFLVDCDTCSAKVAAEQSGQALAQGYIDEVGEPYGEKLLVGRCPHCHSLIAAHQTQLEFENHDSEFNVWSNPIRVFPNPPKTFTHNIPKIVHASILEAQTCVHAGAYTAACVMLRRTMEAVCIDILQPVYKEEALKAKEDGKTIKRSGRPLMLGEGLKDLHSRKLIDERLFEWSKQIQLIGNKSAHAVDIKISRQDANDLMSFVTALIEYIYDLTLRYNEFLERTKPVEPALTTIEP